MTIDQLYSFLAVSKYLNLCKAAESLYLSHSTVSRHIANLEKDLGIRLFNRNTHEVVLTEAGKVLLPEAKIITDGIASAREKMEKLKIKQSARSSVLTLASYPPATYPLANIYQNFCLKHTEINCRIVYPQRSEMVNFVTLHKANIGIIFSFELYDCWQNFNKLKVYTDRFCAVVSSTHPLAGKESINVSDLPYESIFTPNEMSFKALNKGAASSQFRTFAESANLKCPPVESILFNMRAEKKILILPRSVAQQIASEFSILEIYGFENFIDVVLFWPKINVEYIETCFINDISNTNHTSIYL